MTLQIVPGMNEMWLPGYSPIVGAYAPVLVDLTLDAASEVVWFVGHCWLPALTGSKTISAAGGGSIGWLPGASITFANAGTSLIVGIQDVSASGPPGQGDGSDDVYATLVGGTDTITSTTWLSTAMESGTKTIAHGDKIAIAFTMSARGGADSVKLRGAQPAGATVTSIAIFSAMSVLAAPTATVQNMAPNAVIVFDDGTRGFLDGSFVFSTAAPPASTAFNSGSTPDEYGNIFQVPFPCKIDAIRSVLSSANSAGDIELCLYSDPLGTPTLLATATTVDGNHLGNNASLRYYQATLPAALTLAANTNYAVTARPTSANNASLFYWDVNAAADWSAHGLGSAAYSASRTNNTGAFTGLTTRRYQLDVRVSHLDDGAGGGAVNIIQARRMPGTY